MKLTKKYPLMPRILFQFKERFLGSFFAHNTKPNFFNVKVMGLEKSNFFGRFMKFEVFLRTNPPNLDFWDLGFNRKDTSCE